jgi:hypothetical protein
LTPSTSLPGPRKYLPADDSIFLDRIAEGTLRVDLETQKVYTRLHRTKFGEWHELGPFPGRWGYLHVRVYHRGRRKSLALNRLIWIVANGQLIPEGFDIDHYPDRNKRNNHPSNLRLRDLHENRSDNGNNPEWDDGF